jgi:high-affinity nickel-transport protein
MPETLGPLSTFAVLGIGLLFGLKHATEVDHVVAVSTIVSRHRSVWRSSLVGALWGAGHTAALLIAGVFVLTLKITIPERVSNWLEFGVALMIIGLGATALWRALRKRSDLHVHFHEPQTQHHRQRAHTHVVSQIGLKPILIGAMHGLAGSGALTLLVLTQLNSTVYGLLYLAVFGVGSIAGMLLMSGLIGLPFALTSRNLTSLHHRLQTAAAALSLAFGFWYAYQLL